MQAQRTDRGVPVGRLVTPVDDASGIGQDVRPSCAHGCVVVGPDRARLLGPGCPLPLDGRSRRPRHARGVSRVRPFRGCSPRSCSAVAAWRLRREPGSQRHRSRARPHWRSILPPDAVVVDRTAAWLHGVDALRRSSVHAPPPLHVVHITDTRMERAGVTAGRRGLVPSGHHEVHGIRSPRACEPRIDLWSPAVEVRRTRVIDGFLRTGVPRDVMLDEMARFRGYRGVRQLRYLVSIGDGRAESRGVRLAAALVRRRPWPSRAAVVGVRRRRNSAVSHRHRGSGARATPRSTTARSTTPSRRTASTTRSDVSGARDERGWKIDPFTQGPVFSATRHRAGAGRRATRRPPQVAVDADGRARPPNMKPPLARPGVATKTPARREIRGGRRRGRRGTRWRSPR